MCVMKEGEKIIFTVKAVKNNIAEISRAPHAWKSS